MTCRLLPFALLACATLAKAQTAEALVRKTWKAFQAAVARGDSPSVAGMTAFPFRHPSLDVAPKGPLSREQFLAKFSLIFSSGIRRQVEKGTPAAVTPELIREAKEDGADSCGQLGDWVVPLPAGGEDRSQSR